MARKKKQGGITLADIAKGAFMLATAAKLKTKQEVETGLREALPGASSSAWRAARGLRAASSKSLP